MSSGISIDIAADTKPFVTNVNAMADALEQAAAELDKLASSGNGGGSDELTQRLRSEAEQARLTAEQLRQLDTQVSDLRPAVLQPATAFEQLSQSQKKAGDEAEEMAEKGKLGESTLMNVGYASLSAADLIKGPGGILEALGTTAAFMGPSLLGAPGIGAPLAIGLTAAGIAASALGAALGQDAGNAQDLTKAVSDLTGAWLGNAKGLDAVDEGLRAWTKDATDYGGIALTDLKSKLDGTGISYGQVAAALATKATPALRESKKAIDDQIASLQHQNAQYGAGDVAASATVTKNTQIIASLQGVRGAIDTEIEANRTSTEVHKQLAAQMGMTVAQYDAYETALDEARQAQKTFTTDLHSALQSAGQDTAEFTKNGSFDLQGYVSNLNTTLQNQLDLQRNLQSVAPSLTTAGLKYVEKLGDKAGPALAEAVKLGPSNPEYQALIGSWDQAGSQSAQTFGISAKKALPKEIDGPSVKLNTDAAVKQIKELSNQTITIKAKVADQYGRTIG